jgi:hypothetical protein
VGVGSADSGVSLANSRASKVAGAAAVGLTNYAAG